MAREHAKAYNLKGLPMTTLALENAYNQGWQDADANPAWVSVEEEMPKEGQVVLIHTKNNSVSTACYTNGEFDITQLLQVVNVTHWMPITPPEEEE